MTNKTKWRAATINFTIFRWRQIELLCKAGLAPNPSELIRKAVDDYIFQRAPEFVKRLTDEDLEWLKNVSDEDLAELRSLAPKEVSE